jgi:hypothetical protein
MRIYSNKRVHISILYYYLEFLHFTYLIRLFNKIFQAIGITSKYRLLIVLFVFLSGTVAGKGVSEKIITKQNSFEWVFGNLAKFDSAMVQKVLAEPFGKRHYIDRNGDGKPEEVWFIDIDPRHKDEHRPLPVKVIDEDGDLEMGGEPDYDSDLYLADWNANGIIDAAVDYNDLDGDQDVDETGFFFYQKNVGLRVWWSRDDGDDNLLWYDVDYYYYQRPCQDFTHFGGNESFVSLLIKPGEKYWTPFFENPFLFFDRDGDGVTEEVVRVAGKKDNIHSVRWSFDVDNDVTIEHPRDFDVSISAYATGWTLEKSYNSNFNLHFGENESDTLNVRGLPAGPVLARKSAINFLNQIRWERVLFTWDENDFNVAPTIPEYIERWEGVIAGKSEEPGFEFPEIGGPTCGPFNKRYEIVLKPKSVNNYYYSPADHRIHIKNSDKTWMKVDYNGDNRVDMEYQWSDLNRDGIMDKISVDIDADGHFDDSWKLDVSDYRPVKWEFYSINSAYSTVVAYEPENLFYLNRSLTKALESVHSGAGDDRIWNLTEHKMQNNSFMANVSDRLINSDETLLYYLSLSADRRIAKLINLVHGKDAFWKLFYAARGRGDTKKMNEIVIKEFNLNKNTEHYLEWIERLRQKPLKKSVAWDNKWLPPNWGWESEKAAFRFYDGHFDLFGKRMDTLIFPDLANGESYHLDQNVWGMDILHVGKTGGCGGLVLYVDGIAYPVRNNKNSGDPVFSSKLITETPEIVTLEFTAHGAGPENNPFDIIILTSAIAGRYDSPVEVVVKGDMNNKKIELGITLNKLPDEKFFIDKNRGIMGVWGFQQPEIGWIGTGIIFPSGKFIRIDEQPEEHRVVLKYQKGETLHYHIRGDWLRAHRFARSSGKQEWQKTLAEIASRVNLK